MQTTEHTGHATDITPAQVHDGAVIEAPPLPETTMPETTMPETTMPEPTATESAVAGPDMPAHATPGPVAAPHMNEAGLDLLFRTARTVKGWTQQAVPDDLLRQMYELLKLGPTSANCSPARFLLLRTTEAKERLRPALSAGNVDTVMAAPVVCVVAHDPRFFEDLPRLYPGVDARAWFAGNDALATETAFRNGTLQGAYLMMAARAVGLDCAPMSGVDTETVDREFLVAQGWKSNFLVALGHGERSGLPERAPRLTFDEACRLL